jgi:3-(3-hydroxy-phenyl)propionate hydroxylase
MDEPRKRFAAVMSGLDIQYDLGDGHPLLGRRMPDLDLVTVNGPLRVFTLLHDARRRSAVRAMVLRNTRAATGCLSA